MLWSEKLAGQLPKYPSAGSAFGCPSLSLWERDSSLPTAVKIAGTLILALICRPILGQTVLIDAFDIDQSAPALTTDSTTIDSLADSALFFGGRRLVASDVRVVFDGSGPGSISNFISGGLWSVAQETGGRGLGSLFLEDFEGDRAFNASDFSGVALDVQSVQGAVGMLVTSSDSSSEFGLSLGHAVVNGPGVVSFAFPPSMDRSNIDSIGITVTLSPGRSISVGSISFVPEPSSLAIVLGFGLSMLMQRDVWPRSQ